VDDDSVFGATFLKPVIAHPSAGRDKAILTVTVAHPAHIAGDMQVRNGWKADIDGAAALLIVGT